jgi:hypothetical protein
MKEKGVIHWLSPNRGADNSSGFTGLPGGSRGWTAFRVPPPRAAVVPSTTLAPPAFGGVLQSSIRSPFSGSCTIMVQILTGPRTIKLIGLSVRCVRD